MMSQSEPSKVNQSPQINVDIPSSPNRLAPPQVNQNNPDDLSRWTDDEYVLKRRAHHNPTAQDHLYNLYRIIDDDKAIGNSFQSIVAVEDYHRTDDSTDPNFVSYEVQAENIIGNASGLLIGVFTHWMIKHKYPNRRSLNPFYRNFKVLAGVGASVGTTLAYLLPFPKYIQKIAGNLLADILGITFALFAFPYWLVREYVLKTPHNKRNEFAKVGTEGWSKYGKTLLVYGAAAGQLAGALHSHFTGASLSADVALYGGIAGVSAFFLGIILVPVINKCCSKYLQTDKDSFRNNYVRTGMTLGMALGSALGFVLGTILFPGLGTMAGMAIGGAIGSLVGGAAIGIKGKAISANIHKKKDSENSWDYSSRSTSFFFASLGTIVGLFIPVPGGAMVGAALGAAIGGVVGWFAGMGATKVARSQFPEEKKANSMPWTQRMGMGSNICSIIGGVIGLVAGLIVAGPAGALFGVTLGYAIGSFVGSIIGVLYDPKLKPKNKPTPKPLYKPSGKEMELTDALVYTKLNNQVQPKPPERKHEVRSVTPPIDIPRKAVVRSSKPKSLNTFYPPLPKREYSISQQEFGMKRKLTV